MMFKTHLVIGIFIALLFLPIVNYKIFFIAGVLICTFLPDIDMSQSYLGKHKIFRPIQWFVKHRGLFHSFTFAVVIALIFAFYWPILALPFFLGYSGHLIADSLTPEGIRPIWPFKDEVKWRIRTDGKVERVLFYSVIFVNILLLIRLFN